MPGGGICYDFGVYYLTANCESFWSGGSRCIVRAKPCGEAVNIIPGSPEYGQEFDYTNESQVFTILEMKNGVTGDISASMVTASSMIRRYSPFTVKRYLKAC